MTPPVRVLVAPDKFKGTLTGGQAAEAIADGIRRVFPDALIEIAPIADGGEGTVDAALAAGAERHETRVTGPLGDSVVATWALTADGGAVLESASASGLALVTPSPDSARAASSVGTGELIRAALDAGASRVVMGLGGVATTDGGAGALQALGARVLDANGQPVAPGGAGLHATASIDLDGLDPRLASCSVTFACDVTNPLLGEHGAAAVFSPQKGADAASVDELEAALGVWSRLLAASGAGTPNFAGAGAAGGLAVPFVVLGLADIAPGFGLVSDILGLERRLARATHVVTGEGSLDVQSLGGKGPCGVAALARDLGIECAAVAGVIRLSAAQLRDAGFVASAALVDFAADEQEAFHAAAALARTAGEHLARTWLSPS